MKTASCIVGAGFSFVAGLPLTKDILARGSVAVTKRSAEHFDAVWDDYDDWKRCNSSGHFEEYLGGLMTNYLQLGRPPSHWIVEMVASVLATSSAEPRRPVHLRYGVRATWPSRCECHNRLWNTMIRHFRVASVVTTNYDILLERCMRHRPMKRTGTPGFHYGGVSCPQVMRGIAQPFSATDRQVHVELTGLVPLCKLHGSLSWSVRGTRLELYQDMRPAFRRSNDAAIVPPAPDKNIPEWLAPVWRVALETLHESEVWIVCGYSLPEYDVSVRQLLANAAHGALRRVILLDPFSRELAPRWQALKSGISVECLTGLPEGVDQLDQILESERSAGLADADTAG